MEPVTHLLTGAVLARTGLNRKAAYMTAAMVLAAEFPDIDTIWGLRGPLAAFEHHRGITHTFLAVPVEAALITAYFFFTHRLRKTPTTAPPHWLWLFSGCCLALLSHLFLDWTNNYGLRPFFPFNPHWYAGSFVFIFEPVLFLILLLAVVLPALFGLINSEVGARKPLFRGRASAIVALACCSALWLFRFNHHAHALAIAREAAPESTRLFASPSPIDPFTWHVIADTPAAYQFLTVNSRTGLTEAPTPSDTLHKPPTSLPLLAAKQTLLGRVYLDWSSWPVLTETPDTSDANHPLTTVTFSDARFMYNTLLLSGRDTPPLTGTVTLDMQAPSADRVIETRMDGRVQK